ncbi:MAG: holin-associated N-acetylmuramidase [Pseudomonadota bacterium]
MDVDEITRDIIRREGGFVNDPDDRGGATKFGVTIHTMRRLGIDKTGDGQITVADVKALTAQDAEGIFKRHYFFEPKIDKIHGPLQATVYDMFVNAGGNGIKILQRLVREIGVEIAVDGAIGPKTIAGVAQAVTKAPDHIIDAYGIARRNYYYRIGDNKPSQRKYARRLDGGKGGWITRAEEFIARKYHLTDTQHCERTQAWS